MMNGLLLYGAALGLLSVILGAAGDHALAIPAGQEDAFATALRYNMLYAVLIVAIALTSNEQQKGLRIAALIFAAGVTLFSGGIYLSLLTRIHTLIFLTPAGGLTIMAGWTALMVTAFMRLRQKD